MVVSAELLILFSRFENWESISKSDDAYRVCD